MPWEKTPLKDREQRLRSGIATGLGLVAVPGRMSNIGVLSAEVAAEVDDVHQNLDYRAQQMHTATADEENLVIHAARWGLPRHPATLSKGSVTFAGTDGVTIGQNTELRHDSGQTFTTDSEVLISAGTAVVAVTAKITGILRNIADGETLSPLAPIPGVSTEVTVTTAITEGRDQESLDAWRTRLLYRQAHPPMGGADPDYVVWASMINGVSNVWISPKEQGLGTVTLRIGAWDDPDGPIPTEALRQSVADHIDGHINPVTGQWTGRPAGSEVFVVNPVAKVIDLDFTYLNPDDAPTRAAISTAVSAMFRKRGKPGVLIRYSWITEAISKAVGEDYHKLAVADDDVQCGINELPILGLVTVGGA